MSERGGREGGLTRSGERPSPRSCLTLFWVGFVFCSPVALGYTDTDTDTDTHTHSGSISSKYKEVITKTQEVNDTYIIPQIFFQIESLIM